MLEILGNGIVVVAVIEAKLTVALHKTPQKWDSVSKEEGEDGYPVAHTDFSRSVLSLPLQ